MGRLASVGRLAAGLSETLVLAVATPFGSSWAADEQK